MPGLIVPFEKPSISIEEQIQIQTEALEFAKKQIAEYLPELRYGTVEYQEKIHQIASSHAKTLNRRCSVCGKKYLIGATIERRPKGLNEKEKEHQKMVQRMVTSGISPFECADGVIEVTTEQRKFLCSKIKGLLPKVAVEAILATIPSTPPPSKEMEKTTPDVEELLEECVIESVEDGEKSVDSHKCEVSAPPIPQTFRLDRCCSVPSYRLAVERKEAKMPFKHFHNIINAHPECLLCIHCRWALNEKVKDGQRTITLSNGEKTTSEDWSRRHLLGEKWQHDFSLGVFRILRPDGSVDKYPFTQRLTFYSPGASPVTNMLSQISILGGMDYESFLRKLKTQDITPKVIRCVHTLPELAASCITQLHGRNAGCVGRDELSDWEYLFDMFQNCLRWTMTILSSYKKVKQMCTRRIYHWISDPFGSRALYNNLFEVLIMATLCRVPRSLIMRPIMMVIFTQMARNFPHFQGKDKKTLLRQIWGHGKNQILMRELFAALSMLGPFSSGGIDEICREMDIYGGLFGEDVCLTTRNDMIRILEEIKSLETAWIHPMISLGEKGHMYEERELTDEIFNFFVQVLDLVNKINAGVVATHDDEIILQFIERNIKTLDKIKDKSFVQITDSGEKQREESMQKLYEKHQGYPGFVGGKKCGWCGKEFKCRG
ncbi:hypothetical protein ADUPG1_006645, partial [Aduncisulcus paluster]